MIFSNAYSYSKKRVPTSSIWLSLLLVRKQMKVNIDLLRNQNEEQFAIEEQVQNVQVSWSAFISTHWWDYQIGSCLLSFEDQWWTFAFPPL